MTEQEFKKLKVGDKVRIVSKKTGNRWAPCEAMDKWLGEIMTVRKNIGTFVFMEEDKYETFFWGMNCGWDWFPEMIAEKVCDSAPVIVEHLIRGRKTIVKLSNGAVGVANCDSRDKFDVYKGLRIAAEKAYKKCEKAGKENEVSNEEGI